MLEERATRDNSEGENTREMTTRPRDGGEEEEERRLFLARCWSVYMQHVFRPCV